MTTDITWSGTLKDIDKINDLTGFISKLGYLVHRIYFAEDHDKVSFKQYNGSYSGNISLSKSLVTNGRFFGLNLGQLLASKHKYKVELEKKLIENGKKYTTQEVISKTEVFFKNKVLVDRVNLAGISFKYPTESQQNRDDVKYMSSISFVFILGAFIGDTSIDIENKNICEVWNIEDLSMVDNPLVRPLEYSIMLPGVLVRNNSLKELYELLNWVWCFYMNDLKVETFYTGFKETIIPKSEWYRRAIYFEKIKNKFKENCIYLRSLEDINYSNHNNEEGWWEKQKAINLEELEEKYKDL